MPNIYLFLNFIVFWLPFTSKSVIKLDMGFRNPYSYSYSFSDAILIPLPMPVRNGAGFDQVF